MDVDEASVRRAFRAANYSRRFVPVDHVDDYKYTLEAPIEVVTDHIAITADWHVPLYDPEFVNLFLSYCHKHSIRELVIGGDFLNGDALSQYYPKQLNAGETRERTEALLLMKLLLDNFDTIYYIWGNHDYRYVKVRDYNIEFADLMQEFFSSLDTSRIVFSNLDHMYIKSGEDRYYVCHPRSYSSIPLSSAIRMASKLGGAHVLTAHSHHTAVGFASDGITTVAELGGFFDVSKTQYLQRSTTYPNWQPGFALLNEGKFELYSKKWLARV